MHVVHVDGILRDTPAEFVCLANDLAAFYRSFYEELDALASQTSDHPSSSDSDDNG